MEKKKDKESFSILRILGVLGTIILASILLRVFFLFYSVPFSILNLIKFDPVLKSNFFLILMPINLGAAIYTTIWICFKMWSRKKDVKKAEEQT